MTDVYVQRAVRDARGKLEVGFALHPWDPGDNRGKKLGDGWVAVEGLVSFRVDDSVRSQLRIGEDGCLPLLVDDGIFKLWCALGKCQLAR